MNLFMNENLQLIVDVKPGDLICVNQKCILPSNSWSTSFWRTYYLESDHFTIIWLTQVVNDLLHTIYIHRHTANPYEIRNTLNRVDRGLANLQDSYCMNAVIHLKLSEIRSLLFRKK
jgi:hypothetical protein